MTDRSQRVALLIDADNLSGDVIEQAIEHLLKNHGAIHFRRAYCSPQKVIEHMDLFRRHAIRPMVNVPTGKNSTDIALAVDAIDLALSERPDVVVIASSDSDYAPLAQRLREKGCRVLGIGQAGKTGSESPLAYDGFVDLAHRRAARNDAVDAPRRLRTVAVEPPPRVRSVAAEPTSRGRTARGEAPSRERNDSAADTSSSRARSTGGGSSRRSGSAGGTPPTGTADGAGEPAPRPRETAAAPHAPATATRSRKRVTVAADASAPRLPASPSPSPPPLPSAIAGILDAVPSLRSGQSVQLNDVGDALRRHELIKSKSVSPSRFLKRYADFFELAPLDKPRTVRFIGPVEP